MVLHIMVNRIMPKIGRIGESESNFDTEIADYPQVDTPVTAAV